MCEVCGRCTCSGCGEPLVPGQYIHVFDDDDVCVACMRDALFCMSSTTACTTTIANRPVCAEDDADYAPEVNDNDPMFAGVDWAAKGDEFKAFVERTIVELDEAKCDPAKVKCRKEPWL